MTKASLPVSQFHFFEFIKTFFINQIWSLMKIISKSTSDPTPCPSGLFLGMRTTFWIQFGQLRCTCFSDTNGASHFNTQNQPSRPTLSTYSSYHSSSDKKLRGKLDNGSHLIFKTCCSFFTCCQFVASIKCLETDSHQRTKGSSEERNEWQDEPFSTNFTELCFGFNNY